MRLILNTNRVYGPGDTGGFVSGMVRNQLLKVGSPFWKESELVATGFVAEFDGVSNIIDNAMTRSGDSVVTYVDGVRFVKQLADPSFQTVRQPSMPSQIITRSGDLFSAIPIATELDATESSMSDALSSAGFTFASNDFFKFPMYRYVFRQLVMGNIFGSSADAYFGFANRLTRHGPVEQLLTALQPDSETKTLAFLSSGIPFRDVITSDEISVLLDALELGSLTSYATLVSQANALQALRRAEVLNGSQDSTGLSIMLYYAMIHPAFVARLPVDVVLALSRPGSDGVATVNSIAGASVTPLSVRLHESVLPLVPTLRTITADTLSALSRARLLYKMLCVMRLLQLRGIQPSLSYTLPEADRVKLFNLML